MKAAFMGFGFPVLDSVFFERDEYYAGSDAILDRVEQQLGYPVVVAGNWLQHRHQHRQRPKRARLRAGCGCEIRQAAAGEKAVVHQGGQLFGAGYAHGRAGQRHREPISSGALLGFEDKYLRSEGGSRHEIAGRKIPAEISDEMAGRCGSSLDIFKALDLKAWCASTTSSTCGKQAAVNEVNTIPAVCVLPVGAGRRFVYRSGGLPRPPPKSRCVKRRRNSPIHRTAESGIRRKSE